jgi:GTP-binding protein
MRRSFVKQATSRGFPGATQLTIKERPKRIPTALRNDEIGYIGQAGSGEELDQLLQRTSASLPQIALVARSNAGKSSLVNSLLGRKLAIVSKMPGRTRLAHAYQASGFILIDLPGYGYAQGASATEAEKMADIVADIVLDREQTRLVLLLIDSRRMGLMPTDEQMINALNTKKTDYDVVLTKVDSLNKTQTEQIMKDFPEGWFISSRKHIGIPDLKKYLRGIDGRLRL